MAPRVTILLTCYNHLSYLPAALEGVRAQTFRDFEILAIDDGSTDGTREWLRDQPDIRCVFNETNLGTYETLNVGLRLARGELIAVLNDDDLWEPEKLRRQVELLDAHPEVGLVHTGGYFIDGSGNRTAGNPLGFAFPRFDTGDILLGLVYENKIIASAALARRACFDQLGGFNRDYFGSGDWEMWFRIAERWLVGFVDEPLTMYRVHGANASHKLERIWRDDQKLREWIAERLEEVGDRFPADDLRRAKAFNQAALGTILTLNGEPAAGRAAYLRSIRLDPLRWKSYARWIATFLGPKTFRKML
ncbi:glycosyltransferase [Fimbriimonas ginsengisoli]|uniref:Putative glycosyl transferase n=1 Tax=Fimbriimonas ginsengisoli Gsoil 348 TaxID=661478 RepID=A0A068NN12_FIMGI|nr:glycosyltransferase [Fimbriimonas ginsengisoli]AIE84115.1 putative glycosyl transferase [Fimbriimonas ginsengisoli Gsoil 348]